jgi:hypothetical protein
MIKLVHVAAVAAAALLLAGCTSTAPETTRPTPTRAAAAVPVGESDGILTIATIFTDPSAPASRAAAAGAELALREVDEGGGALGADVVLVHRAAAADGALPDALIADLTARSVDVVLWNGGDVPTELTGAFAVVRVADAGAAAGLSLPDDAFQARLRSADPSLADLHGGAEAYDTTIAVALASVVGENDSAASIASSLPLVASGDVECTSWGECLAALGDNQTIRYTGPSSSPITATAEPASSAD